MHISKAECTQRPRKIRKLAPSYVNLELALCRAADRLDMMAEEARAKGHLQREINYQAVARHLNKLASDCGPMVELHRSLSLAFPRSVVVVSCNGNWIEIVKTLK